MNARKVLGRSTALADELCEDRPWLIAERRRAREWPTRHLSRTLDELLGLQSHTMTAASCYGEAKRQLQSGQPRAAIWLLEAAVRVAWGEYGEANRRRRVRRRTGPPSYRNQANR